MPRLIFIQPLNTFAFSIYVYDVYVRCIIMYKEYNIDSTQLIVSVLCNSRLEMLTQTYGNVQIMQQSSTLDPRKQKT